MPSHSGRKLANGRHYDEVKAWTEVMAAKRHGRIATLIIQGKERFKVDEVKELAKRFSFTMGKVVRWLRDESRPQLVDVLAEKKQGSLLKPTDSQVENTRGDAPEEDIAPKTLAEFECMLEEHPETRQHRGFQKSYDQILAFYKMKQVAESGELDYLPKQVKWKRLSQRFEVSEYTIKSWFTGQHIPRLIHLLTHLKRKQLSEEIADHRAGRIQSSEKASIESLKGIEELLARHPHLRNQKGFDEKYIRVLLFYEMKMIMNAEPGVRVSEISRKLNLPYNTVRNWIINRTRPQLMTQLLNNEQMRLRHEARLNPKALLNRIDPSLVHDVVRPLGESRQPSIEVAAETLQQLFSESQRSGRVMFLEMQHYNRGGPKWLNRAAQYIKEHLEQIEPLLNSQLAADGSITIRLGFVNNKLYMWKRDANPYSYLNMFADELFYFHEADWTQLIVESQAHLGLKGRVHLSQLIRQISNYGGNNETRVGRYNIDLYSKSYLASETYHFLVDASGAEHRNSLNLVRRIGFGRQIHNPQYLEQEILLELLARLYATIGSDGSIESDYSVKYYECNHARREKVAETLAQLGEVGLSNLHWYGRLYGFRMPPVIGRLLVRVGMPIGDKVLQGVRLPGFIINGSLKIQLAYLEELLPEEASFTVSRGKYAKIVLNRSVVLYDPNKGNRYEFEQEIERRHAEFIRQFGKMEMRSYGREASDQFYVFSLSKLRNLVDSAGRAVSTVASELLDVVLNTPPRYLLDEQRICDSIGIGTKVYPGVIALSERTNRVSVRWCLQTSGQDEAIKWVLLAPPNDVIKRKKTIEWMKQHSDRVGHVKERLRRAGLMQG